MYSQRSAQLCGTGRKMDVGGRGDKWRISFILSFFSNYHTRFTLLMCLFSLSMDKEMCALFCCVVLGLYT